MVRIGRVLGVVGGLGAGWTFVISMPLMLDFLGLGLVPRYLGVFHAFPVVLVAAAALTAMVAGRFGWIVTAAGAVAAYALREIDIASRTTESLTALYVARSAAEGIVLGGALAAFAAADREPGHFAAVAVGGVLLGAVLARYIAPVPWEAIALVGAAGALLASQPPSLQDLAEGRTHFPTGPVIAVALVGLAIAAMLLRLGDRVPELRAVGPAGFATFAVAGVLAAPQSGFVLFESPIWDRRAIAIGVAGLAVLALHLVSVTRRQAPVGPA
jgi:hypothetical protein